MRARRWMPVILLTLAAVLVLVGVVLAGARVAQAADIARETGVDLAAAYFLGTAATPIDLVASIAPIVLVVVGIVLAAATYGRVVSSGESVAMVRLGMHPLASREEMRQAGRGRV